MKRLYEKSKHFKVIDRHISRVPERLKELDAGYFVLWNSIKNRFEVHNSDQRGSTLAFTTDFDELDNRTLIKARRSAVHRADKLMEEIRRDEIKMEEDRRKKAGQAFEERASLAYDKLMRKPRVVVK